MLIFQLQSEDFPETGTLTCAYLINARFKTCVVVTAAIYDKCVSGNCDIAKLWFCSMSKSNRLHTCVLPNSTHNLANIVNNFLK